MSQISDLVDDVIQSGLAVDLKQNGFRKDARTFRKSLTDCILITNVQGSRWNQGTTGRFTMNLGVYFPGVAQLSWLPMPANKNRPSTHDCLLETRIGALTPNYQDYWWEIKPSSNLRELSSDVLERWKTHGKTWLEQLIKPQSARDYLVKHGQPWKAMLFSYFLGDTESAKEQLQNEIRSTTNTAFINTLRHWAESRHLDY